MPSKPSRVKDSAEKHAQHDTGPAPENKTMKEHPAIWCLAELEKKGEMHPDAYRDGKAIKEGQLHSQRGDNGSFSSTAKKRKDRTCESTAPPPKAPRRSKRADDSSSKQSPDPVRTLRFLLTPHALPLTVPSSESCQPSSTRTYASSRLTPFEELLSAVVLSRPISHALGQRTIRTILNAPYGFTTPEKVRGAGDEERMQALRDARTQHKDKTVDEIAGLADVVIEQWAVDESDGGLGKLREAAGNDANEERRLLKDGVKGLGETGLDIFFRRVQWLWDEVYPFVDKRTAKALEKLGLPGSAEELKGLLEENWEELRVRDIGLKDEEEKRRRAYVLVLERAVGAELEKRGAEVLEGAVKEG